MVPGAFRIDERGGTIDAYAQAVGLGAQGSACTVKAELRESPFQKLPGLKPCRFVAAFGFGLIATEQDVATCRGDADRRGGLRPAVFGSGVGYGGAVHFVTSVRDAYPDASMFWIASRDCAIAARGGRLRSRSSSWTIRIFSALRGPTFRHTGCVNLAGYQEQMERLGMRLRALRRARGLTMRIADQVRLRYGVKLDPSYLSRIERGQAALPLRTLFALADYFGVEAGALLLDADEKTAAGPRFENLGLISAEEFSQVQRLIRVALVLLTGEEGISAEDASGDR